MTARPLAHQTGSLSDHLCTRRPPLQERRVVLRARIARVWSRDRLVVLGGSLRIFHAGLGSSYESGVASRWGMVRTPGVAARRSTG